MTDQFISPDSLQGSGVSKSLKPIDGATLRAGGAARYDGKGQVILMYRLNIHFMPNHLLTSKPYLLNAACQLQEI